VTIALRVAAFLAVSYLVIVLIAWLVQDSLAFPAPRHILPDPGDLGARDGIRVSIAADDGIALHGWYLPPVPPPDSGRAPALLWFTGNMETVGAMGSVLLAMRPPGTAVLAVDYRGYGENDGRPTEGAVYRDAEAVWRWLETRPEVDAARIAVYGRSVGSAPATWLVARHQPVAVVLDSPFTSARDMAHQHYWFLPRFLTRLELDNAERLRHATMPVLILHGTDDRIAPFTMGRTLAAGIPRATFVEIRGAGHNDTYTMGGAMYRDTVHAFLVEAFAAHAP